MNLTTAIYSCSLNRNLFTSSSAMLKNDTQRYLLKILADISISTAYFRRNGILEFDLYNHG
jgi:hypothetical protein